MKKNDFGNALVMARESRGMNGNDLAKELGVSATAIHKWENGIAFPGPGRWKDIEDAVGINPQRYKGTKKPDQSLSNECGISVQTGHNFEGDRSFTGDISVDRRKSDDNDLADLIRDYAPKEMKDKIRITLEEIAKLMGGKKLFI